MAKASDITSLTEQVERDLIKSAVLKRQRGEPLTASDLAAIKRYERRTEEEKRWQYYRTVPQKHYRQMSGRQTKVLGEQAERYGIPCSGGVIDIGAVLRWIHDFLAKNSHRILDGEMAESSGASKALERCRTAQAELQEMQLARVRGQLIEREDVLAMVGECAARTVQCMSILENSIATEFSLWLADPKIQVMGADERARIVRDFVARTCYRVRQAEADGVEAMIEAALAADEEADSSAVCPN